MRNARLTFYILGFLTLFCQYIEANNGYSYADCTYVKGGHNSIHYGGRCFCFNSGTVIKWKDCWSTFQVRVTSDEDVFIVYPMEARNCHDPDSLVTLSKCLLEHYWPSTVQMEEIMDIPLVEEDVCFMLKSPRASSEYLLEVTPKRLNRIRFALFAFGFTIFFFAGTICRSSVFFYTSGVLLGMLSLPMFVLFFLKSVLQRGVFLVLSGAVSGLSYLGMQKVMENWDELMTLYMREVLGYLFLSGFISFAVCYKHGPIISERTLALLTWCMQAGAMLLLHWGITFPPASYTLQATLLGIKLLPFAYSVLHWTFRQLVWLCRCFLGLFGRRSPKIRLLTEEEYREQGEVYTKASLEELRERCNSPGFPAWDTVLRLSFPQRFAKFLRGGSHVTAAEMQAHEGHYGPGGQYYENMLCNLSQAPMPLQGACEDMSEDEPESYTHGPPTPDPLSLQPSLCQPPADPYSVPICPYPLIPYNPHPEPSAADDLDDYF